MSAREGSQLKCIGTACIGVDRVHAFGSEVRFGFEGVARGSSGRALAQHLALGLRARIAPSHGGHMNAVGRHACCFGDVCDSTGISGCSRWGVLNLYLTGGQRCSNSSEQRPGGEVKRWASSGKLACGAIILDDPFRRACSLLSTSNPQRGPGALGPPESPRRVALCRLHR